MAAKDTTTLVEKSGGQLSYIQHWELNIGDTGIQPDENIDFTGLTLEGNGRSKVNHLTLMNDGGANDVYVVFDSTGSTITTTDRTTYNTKVYAGKPYTEMILHGEASSIGLRCESGKTTTLKIIAW